ncbi:BTAD domain-containing putative transcriptional regulator [Streptomyces cyaneofuscatus]
MKQRVTLGHLLLRAGHVVATGRLLGESEPLCERSCGQRMLVLCRCVRQADALHACRHVRDVLVEISAWSRAGPFCRGRTRWGRCRRPGPGRRRRVWRAVRR